MFILWIALIPLLIYLFYKWAKKNDDYFKKSGNITFDKPYFMLGSALDFIVDKLSFNEWISRIYSKYPNEKFIGYFEFMTPIYFLRDPEIIKQICVKDFHHFADHPKNILGVNDPYLENALLLLTGQKWRDVRTSLSPIFTGSKMRQMFQLVTECGVQTANYFRKESQITDFQVLDMKDVFSRFTCDIIATCAFGIKVDSYNDRENEFFRMGSKMLGFTAFQKFKLMLLRFVPKIATLFQIKFISGSISNFFRILILDTMQVREKQNIFRPDLIHLLMQMKKGTTIKDHNKNADEYTTVMESAVIAGAPKENWSENEVIGQCLSFFLGGFDTASTLLSFAANELALNYDIQDRLYKEILAVYDEVNGDTISYERIQSMPYMDMVISEALRKWPPAAISNRECTKEYDLIDPDTGIMCKIMPKAQVLLPIYAIHMDPAYFPDPEKFDPERFNADNIDNIQSGTYLPFGLGPRNCIGSRFALMQIKGVLYYLLKDFQFEICSKTILPMKLGKITLVPEEGIHLGLRAR